MSYEDLVTFAVDNELDGLDMTVYWLPSTADSYLLPLRRLAYKNGVEIYSISVRTEMTQPTPELRTQQAAEIRKWVDVAAKLGAGHIRVFGGKVPKGRTEEEAASWVVETLKASAPYAAEKGVILGLENHGGITERAETILSIIKRVDSPWVAVNLDTGNFKTQVAKQVNLLLPYAANVQLKAEIEEDGQRREADWNVSFQALAKSGYRGYVALEYEAKEDPATAVPRLSRRLRELCVKYSA